MRLLRFAAAAAVLAAATYATATNQWPWRRLHVAPPIVVSAAFAETADTLRRGETVGSLLSRQGVTGLDLAGLARALRFDPTRLRAGLVFNIRRSLADSEPSEVTVRADAERRIRFKRVGTGWRAEAEAIEWTPELVTVEGGIERSLYEALDEQVDDALLAGDERMRLAWDLADVFAWQVDFSRDIQKGDRFRVVLERQTSSEGEVRFGRVAAADLTVGGKSLTAYAFEQDGKLKFFDADGRSLQRAFLKAPVEFRRISSGFSRSRRHPVLGIFRAHQGIDYAAASGTPVMAAGDGVVTSAGWMGGYGRVVEIRHRSGITTRYGHLSGIASGVRTGARVSQGQTIGFVGASGLATGPHLHYEFRVNGVARDPRGVDLGEGAPLADHDRKAFQLERDRLRALLYGQPQAVATRAG